MVDRRHIIIFFGAALGPLGGNAVVTLIGELEKSFSVNNKLSERGFLCKYNPYTGKWIELS